MADGKSWWENYTSKLGPVGSTVRGIGNILDNAYLGKPGSKKRTGSQKGVTVGTPGMTGSVGDFRKTDESKSALGDFWNYYGVGSNVTSEDPNAVGAGGTGDIAAPNDLFSALKGLFGTGGGSSASERLAALKAQNATRTAGGILDMISSGSYKTPYDSLRNTLATYLQGAQSDIGKAYGGAEAAVKKAYESNPYANITGTATVNEPALMGLLQSQGASTDPLSQLVAANREAAAQRAAAFTDLNRGLGTSFTARGQEALGALGEMQSRSLLDLLGQGGAYGQQIASNEAAALAELQKSLTEAAGQGADIQALVRQRSKKKGRK